MALICWFPLLVLSAIGGRLLGGDAAVPFLLDIDVHLRFLVAVPLLITAESIVHQRMRNIVKMFLDRRLIPENAMTRFEEIINAALRLRNSVTAEVILLIFVYFVGVLIVWRHYIALDAATWYATPSDNGPRFSLAGMWYGYVSLPVFQFLLARWYFPTIHLEPISLASVAHRIGLDPHQSGPRRRLGISNHHGARLRTRCCSRMAYCSPGSIANRIFYLHATLLEFKPEVITLTVFLLCLVAAPLLVFTPLLAHAKRAASRTYGTLAQRYGREFASKWLDDGASPGEPLLGAADIQSLADMGNSVEVVRTMRTTLLTKEVLMVLGGAVIAPVLPLALTMMPLNELVKKLSGVLF